MIAGYIVDFYCPELRLAIEVDGGVHEAQRERDERRTRHLAELGVTVVRIPNERVFSDLAGVLEQIIAVGDKLRGEISP